MQRLRSDFSSSEYMRDSSLYQMNVVFQYLRFSATIPSILTMLRLRISPLSQSERST